MSNQQPAPSGATQLLNRGPVPAADPWWAPPIIVHKGERYFFRATGKWLDASIEHDPNGRNISKLDIWKFLIRHKAADATWFTLIGSVDKNPDSFFSIGDGSRWPDGWVAPSTGQLYCFANDVRFMYCNNSQSIILEIWK